MPIDEVVPGGRYMNEDHTRFHDANGKDLGPVEEGVEVEGVVEQTTESTPEAEPTPEPTPAEKRAATRAANRAKAITEHKPEPLG